VRKSYLSLFAGAMVIVAAEASAFSAYQEVIEMFQTTRFSADCTITVSDEITPGNIEVAIVNSRRDASVAFGIREGMVVTTPSGSAEEILVTTGDSGSSRYWRATGLVRSKEGELFDLSWLVNDDTRQTDIFKIAPVTTSSNLAALDCGL